VLQRVAVYVVDVDIGHRHSYIDACMYIHMQIGRHARHDVGFGGSRRPGVCVICGCVCHVLMCVSVLVCVQ